jgi:hypothetical protein
MTMSNGTSGYANYQMGGDPAWPSSTGAALQKKLGNQTPGQMGQYFHDETPKYIRNLR